MEKWKKHSIISGDLVWLTFGSKNHVCLVLEVIGSRWNGCSANMKFKVFGNGKIIKGTRDDLGGTMRLGLYESYENIVIHIEDKKIKPRTTRDGIVSTWDWTKFHCRRPFI